MQERFSCPLNAQNKNRLGGWVPLFRATKWSPRQNQNKEGQANPKRVCNKYLLSSLSYNITIATKSDK